MKKISLLICCLASYAFSSIAAAETPKPDTTPSRVGRDYPLDVDSEDEGALKSVENPAGKKFFYNDPCDDDDDCPQPHYQVDVHLEGPDYPNVKPVYKPKPKPPTYVHKPVYYPSYAPVYQVPEPIYHQPIYYPHYKPEDNEPEKPEKPETPTTNTTQRPTANSTQVQNATTNLISQVQQSVNSSFTNLANMWAAIRPQLLALQKPKEHVFHHHHYYHHVSDAQKPNSTKTNATVNHYYYTSHPPPHYYPHGAYKPYYRTTKGDGEADSYYRYMSDEAGAELYGEEDQQPGKTRSDAGSTEKTTISSESSKPSKGHKAKSTHRAASDSGILPQLLWPFSSKPASSHARRQSKVQKE